MTNSPKISAVSDNALFFVPSRVWQQVLCLVATPSTLLGDFLLNSDQLLCELRSIFVTKSDERRRAEDTRLESVLAQGLAVLSGLVSSKFSVRILARLNDEFLRYDNTILESQDIKIAYLTVLRADEGALQPWRTAFWQATGEQPESLIPFWMCSKDAVWDEYFPLSMLPIRFHKDWPGDYLRGKMIAERAREAKLPPKKPVQSVRPKLNEEVA